MDMEARLRAIQTREELTDTAFAARLGISRPLWNRIKHGHMTVSERVAMKAAGAFPELMPLLLDAAVSAATNGTRSAA